MAVLYLNIKAVNGPLLVVEGIKNASYGEIVELVLNNKDKRRGRIVDLSEDFAVIEVFEGTSDISVNNTSVELTGKALELSLSDEILGRVFDGTGRPKDGLGKIYGSVKMDINGLTINPLAREYPRNFIQTGISSIDTMITLVRGQKLPVFSGNGLKHNELAAQIIRQAKIKNSKDSRFAVVFAAIGVKHDVAGYFNDSFRNSNVSDKVVMYINLAGDPAVERIITPRCALTAAEYLAFDLGMETLVIMTDMTAYCESIREISSSKGEIPSRKGFPGYLYSDLASLYERAGIIKGMKGSITQLPILTMPNDDITHPVADLTGYITEGQIVLDRDLSLKGIYPPISVLPSLSRLMKDGIGAEFTREDHPHIAAQLFASYAKVQEVRALSSIIGEDELGAIEKLYMAFGREFENKFLSQSVYEERSLEESLNLAWKIISVIPKSELNMIEKDILNKYYPEVN